MRTHSLVILLVLVVMNTCSSTDHSIRFEGITNGVARFEIENPTPVDIAELDVELTYLGSGNSVILVDTVTYNAKKPDGSADVFLKATSSTFIVQRVPDGTAKAKGRVISVRP